MKKYLKEIIITILQILIFYLLPNIAIKVGPIGIVFLLLLATLILSIVVGTVLKNKFKYFYPVLTAILFMPSIFIYYNGSALIHSLWYLVISSVGLLMGVVLKKILN